MTRRGAYLILVVSSDPERLHGYRATARAAGFYALPAPTLDRSIALARKVRPSLVLVDAGLDEGRALAVVGALRAAPRPDKKQAPVVVVGELTDQERDQVSGDPSIQAYPGGESAGLVALLRDLLPDQERRPRPTD